MTEALYNTLWHFTEKLTRDPDDRQELVLMAWKEMQRLGGKADIALLINYMKLRAKELDRRSALGAKISGKSIRDAWHTNPVSLDKPLDEKKRFTLGDTVASYSYNPLGMCIVNNFDESLPRLEHAVAGRMVAGYNGSEISSSLGISRTRFLKTRDNVRRMAVEYLV
jgi:hypothetical protein